MTMRSNSVKPRDDIWAPLAVGLVGLLFTAYVVGTLLAGSGWNPSLLIKFPEIDTEALAYAESLLGDVSQAPGYGHDGKYYFIQAQDPFYLSPEDHARLLDRPTYRAQRMLYPTLAGGFGLLSPIATAWGLILLNVIASGLGSWITARIAQDLRISALVGLGFAFNPGILVSSLIDTAEVLAMLFFVLAGWMVIRGRMTAAAVAISLAALSRETMILAAIAIVVYAFRHKVRRKSVLALPFIVTLVWWVYLRARIGYLAPDLQDTQAIGLPFQGFAEAAQGWMAPPVDIIDLLIGVLLLTLAIVIPFRTYRDRSLFGLMASGFGVIAVLMVASVWRNYFDATRVLAPFITAYLLMGALGSNSLIEPDRNVAGATVAVRVPPP